MSIEKLFKGVAVIIDDEIGVKDASINTIISEIKSKNIPCLEYKELPNENIIEHLHGISFLLLDWKLVSIEHIEEGVRIPADISDEYISANIEFLKKITKSCFVPIFIFSHEPIETIQKKLIDENICQEGKPNFILLKSKSNVVDNKLFSEIENWIKSVPSIYVLKQWELEYYNAKNALFNDFYALNHAWPKILWDTYTEDGANQAQELGETITRNLCTRMTPFGFDSSFISCNVNPGKDEIRKVLEGERFITKIDDAEIGTGDLFKEEYSEPGVTKYRYYLNIRAQCDLIRCSEIDRTEIYCIRGRVVDEAMINQENGGVKIDQGQFIDKINSAVVAFIDNGKIIEFLFRDLKICEWGQMKSKRIGRLLPPHITRIQQRYGLYLQRQGLPRIPKEAISDDRKSGK